MKDINKAIKIAASVAITSICAFEIWDISNSYQSETEIKVETQRYIEAQTNRLQESSFDEDIETGEIANISGEDAYTMFIDAILTEPVYHPQSRQQETIVNPFIISLQEEINSDITAWLSIPGTKIDYPVLKAEDNEYYTRTDIYHNDAKAGSIFADYRCNPEFSGFYTIIYGHNMRNRSMFGDLKLYADPGFLVENRYGQLITASRTYDIEIFAYMVVSSDDPEIYANPGSRDAFFDYIKENARVYRTPENGDTIPDKIIALSTCSYEFEAARTVVFASLLET